MIIMLLLQRAIRIWPAVILAAKRTESVMGRMIWLTVSTSTMKLDRAIGVLRGTKWLKKCCVLFFNLNSTRPVHKGSLKLSEISM